MSIKTHYPFPLQRSRSKRRGFTLIELLVVFSVIGLVSTLSITSFSTTKAKAKIAKGLSYEQSVYSLVADDAVAIWDFNECTGTIANDISGNAHHATLLGTTWSTDTPAKQGCSLSFDGSSAQVDPSYTWSFNHQNFTASAWYKTKKSGEQVIFMVGDENVLEMLNGRLRVNLLMNAASAPKKTNDNIWHFVAITGDAGSIRVYVDGQSKPDITITGDTDSYSGDLVMGRCTGGSWYFSGLLDDIRIYQRSLTAKEIQTLYAKGASKLSMKQ